MEDTVKKIKLGRLTIVANPGLAAPKKSAQSRSKQGHPPIQAQNVAISEAERIGGFKIFRPSWLPTPTTKLVRSQSFVLPAPDSNQVFRVLSTQQIYQR
jgi:hypothetical protein